MYTHHITKSQSVQVFSTLKHCTARSPFEEKKMMMMLRYAVIVGLQINYATPVNTPQLIAEASQLLVLPYDMQRCP